jgi:hypothetical protein
MLKVIVKVSPTPTGLRLTLDVNRISVAKTAVLYPAKNTRFAKNKFILRGIFILLLNIFINAECI